MVNKSNRSKRLETALRLGYGPVIADIGCDHGKLAIQAIQSGQANHAYAIDNKELPLSKARQNIALASLEESITLKLSNGLDDILFPVDTCYILGMGGLTIRDILMHPHRESVKQFVLGAHSDVKELRWFLMQEGYLIREEEFIEDTGKFYVLMAVIKGHISYTEEQLEFGPKLLQKKPVPWVKWLRKIEQIYIQAIASTRDVKNRSVLIKKLEQVRRILHECN